MMRITHRSISALVLIFTVLILYSFISFQNDENLKFQLPFDNEKGIKTICNANDLYCKKFANDDIGLRLNKLNKLVKYCEDLVEDWTTFNMSKMYYDMLPAFKERLNKTLKQGNGHIEGHTGLVPIKMMLLHYLAGSKSIKTVCETGFNGGHSSFNFLTSNPDLKVYTFDLGEHSYAPKMANYLSQIFGVEGRFTARFGDSSVEIPKAISNNTLPLCDLIFVDGGHAYPTARADIMNLGGHSSEHNIIIFDDYPNDWGMNFGKAWDEMLVSEIEANKKLKKPNVEVVNKNNLSNQPKTDQTIKKSNIYKINSNDDSIKNNQIFGNNNDNDNTKKKKIYIVESLRCILRHPGTNFQRGISVGRVIIH